MISCVHVLQDILVLFVKILTTVILIPVKTMLPVYWKSVGSLAAVVRATRESCVMISLIFVVTQMF